MTDHNKPRWFEKALCVGKYEKLNKYLFPKRAEDGKFMADLATELCRYCPARVECLRYHRPHLTHGGNCYYGGFGYEDQRLLADHPEWTCLCPHPTASCNIHRVLTPIAKKRVEDFLETLDNP